MDNMDMASNILFIVEAPKKVKTISNLFPSFTVKATVGHIVDLPLREMGVSLPAHNPHYVTMKGKDKTIASLRKAANESQIIYIATDLDREGEAIAKHVKNLLGSKHVEKVSRVTYSEISKKAIQAAIDNKRDIYANLVSAQEARRVIDRYVGYLISPALTKKIKLDYNLPSLVFLSAGRVQSVAVKLIVERELQRQRFKPLTHYGVKVVISQARTSFVADWVPMEEDLEPQSRLVTSQSIAKAVELRTKSLSVVNVENKRVSIAPPKPLTSQSFIQLCAEKLKLTTKLSMAAAQRLYEAGLITYHRTDSPVMSDEAISQIRGYAARHTLPIPNTAPTYKAGANSQEAHECLRVSSIEERHPAIENEADKRVYQLIWEISLLCQLSKGVDNKVIVTIKNTEDDTFRSTGQSVNTLGWRQFNSQFFGVRPSEHTDKQSGQEKIQTLPPLSLGDAFDDVTPSLITKKTKSDPSYTEKTLVKKLEVLGVGRPSTYAQTIEKIITMEYVQRDSKTLVFTSTPLGVVIVAYLNQFSFMDEHYTATIEESFDKIANKQSKYFDVVDTVYHQLKKEMDVFESTAKPPASISSEQLHPFCAKSKYKPAASKKGRSRKQTNDNTATGNPGESCPQCKQGLLEKRFFKGDKSRPFIGCSGFPTCRYFAWKPSVSITS